MENSNYPFLFKNELNEECLLFCLSSRHEKNLKLGEFPYTKEQNKILLLNLNTREEYELNIPVFLSSDHKLLDTYIYDYGETEKITELNDGTQNLIEIIDLKNPHVKAIDNKILLIFTASVVFKGNSKIQNFLAKMESSSLNLKDLSNLEFIQYSKAGTLTDTGDILYVQEQKDQYLIDKLVLKKNGVDKKLEIDLKYFDIKLIDRVCSVYDTPNFVFTCTLASDGLTHTFMLYDNLSKCFEVFLDKNNPMPISTFYLNRFIYVNQEKDLTQYINRHLLFNKSDNNFCETSGITNYIDIPDTIELEPMSIRGNNKKFKFPSYIEYKMPVSSNTVNSDKSDQQKINTLITETNNIDVSSEAPTNNELISSEGKGYPGVFTMAKNFGSSMVKWAKSGFQTVDEESIFNARLEICKACPEWDSKALSGTGRCKICGCSTKAKLRLATESCPKNLWGPVTEI
jgi:hypothetical protein